MKTCETQCRSCAARCHRQYGDYPTREEALKLLFREQAASLGVEYVGLKDSLGHVPDSSQTIRMRGKKSNGKYSAARSH